MIGYIYKTTNLINGKIYIGQHKSESFTESYKGSGKYISRAINKYGWDNLKVEMLVPCFSLDELNEEEIYCIHHYNSTDKSIGYNLTSGGGGHLNYSPTEETRAKISAKALGNKSFLGKTHSDKWKDMMSSKMKDREFSDETRKKMSESAKGKVISESTRLKLSEAGKGRKLSEESKKKISLANAGKLRSAETRAKISKANTGRRFSLSEEARAKISIANSNRVLSESAHENLSRSSCIYIYEFDGIEFYGDRKIMSYMRDNGYPKFSNTTLKKLVSGLEVKGYSELSGKISRRLVGDAV